MNKCFTAAAAFVVAIALLGTSAWYFWRGSSGAENSSESSRRTASANSLISTMPEKSAPRPPGLSAAVAVAAEGGRIAAFASKLRADDYCGIWSILEGADTNGSLGASFPAEIQYRALEVAAGGGYDSDPCLNTAMATTRDDLMRLTEGKDSNACRFIRGALLTGQWEVGHDQKEVSGEERRQGIEILRQLAIGDPRNGILPLFYLGALEDGREREMLDAYQEFLRADHFTDPVQGPLQKNLQALSRTGPTAWLIASSVGSMSGNAKYMPASGRAAAFAKQGIHAADFELFVQRLTEQLADIDRGAQRLPYLNLLTDAVLNGVAKSGRKFLSAEASANAKYLDQKAWMAYYRRRTFVDTNLIGGEHEGCEAMITAARKLYPDYVD